MTMTAFLPDGPITMAEHADTLLELAFLVTSADGKLAHEEAAAFRELVARVRGKAASDDEIGALYSKFTKALDGSSCIDRVKKVAPALPTELREPTFRVALALALIDRDANPKEDDLIDALFHALGLDEARAEEVAKEVRSALSPPPNSHPPV